MAAEARLKDVGAPNRPQNHGTDQRRGENAREDPQWVVSAYREYGAYVWALLGRLGVPGDSIEDVVQEVFLVLHRRRHEFRGESSVRTWLHGIAIHTARRYRAKLQRIEHAPVEPEPRARASTPETEVSAQQALRRLDHLLDQLSDEQREVFVLSEIAELSAPEVAKTLGIKLNTVYSRLRLARGRLRCAFEEPP